MIIFKYEITGSGGIQYVQRHSIFPICKKTIWNNSRISVEWILPDSAILRNDNGKW